MSTLPASFSPLDSNRKTVLIVDNDDSLQHRLQGLLEDVGFVTRATRSGYEALRLLEGGWLDVLVVDDYIADMHIHDFLARVHHLPTHPWIVVMQAATPTQNQIRRYALLGATVVRKHQVAEVTKAVSTCCPDYSLAKIRVN